MTLFNRFWKRSGRDDRGSEDGGYYALYDPPRPLDPEERTTSYREAGSTDFSRWDAGLSSLDSSAALVPEDRGSFTKRAFWLGRRKRWWAVRIIAALIMLFIALVAWLTITAPLSKSLEPIAAPQVTLLASDGTPIARSGAMVAAPVKVADLPDHVTQPFLAIEDRRFYSHWGVDPRGIARAIWTGRGGGSTITQQLAKFTWLTSERSLTRKAQEALIAFWIEAWLTKDEILERYLSNAYFGDNQYGLRAASLHYFYRKPENLKPEQAAMLAGLLQAPSRYNPAKHYGRAKRRMDLVVGAMVDAGYISQAEADRLPDPRLDVRTRNDVPTGTYFADWALPLAREGMERGYEKQVIETTLDAQLQALANRVVGRAGLGEAQVGLVAMRPSGEVVAMVGGKSYADSPFNRVTQAKRQPGSTFKLFVYLAALEAGWDPDDTISNQPIEKGSYRPKNSGERYSEEITLEDAFASSSNVAAVRLFNEVGSEQVIRTARSLGVRSDLPTGDPSMALGTSSMSLLELTAAYAGVAANEYPVRPYAFGQQEESWWDWLTSQEESSSQSVHEEMEQMLRAAINRGTGEAAELPIANFGKTGTTQNYRDALFVGYAGDLVVGVWVGNDDNSPLGGISGGGLPARIWKDFMRGALDLPAPTPKASPDPEGPVEPFDIDIEEGEEIPLGEDGTSLRFEEGGLILSQDGVPVELRLTEDGFEVENREN